MFPLKNTTFFNLSLNVEDSRLFIVLVLLQDNKGTNNFLEMIFKASCVLTAGFLS